MTDHVPAAAEGMPSNPTAAREAAVAEAMRELEDDICSLHNMARILGDMLDNDLVGFADGVKVHMPQPGTPMKVLLTYGQMECLSFAWNDVISRAKVLRDKYEAAWDAGGVAQ